MTDPGIAPDDIQPIVEAVLLTADAPVTPGRLVDLFDGLTGRDIRTAIDALKDRYAEAGHAFTITEVAGGFQLVTQSQYSPWLRKFHQDRHQIRLSQAALESLSIIAFKQPITRILVDSIRGVNSSGVLHKLMELNLIRMVGRSDGIGKPMLFGTTRDFLIHFGLKSLADLPKVKELEELLAESGDQLQTDNGEAAVEETMADSLAEGAEENPHLPSDQVDEDLAAEETTTQVLEDEIGPAPADGRKDSGEPVATDEDALPPDQETTP